MTLFFEDRLSDSPYIDTVTQGCTLAAGCSTRPAETNWHMVITRFDSLQQVRVVGPWSTAGSVRYGPGAEILWIRFKLGVFMPRRPTHTFRDQESLLPAATGQSFWLDDRAWQHPTFDTVEAFAARLARDGAIDCDPLVTDALHDQPTPAARRTVRHRFLQAAGQPHSHIRQIERAKHAEALLLSGRPILDVVYNLGYFDQPHLTRVLKQYVGHTPAQIIRQARQARVLDTPA